MAAGIDLSLTGALAFCAVLVITGAAMNNTVLWLGGMLAGFALIAARIVYAFKYQNPAPLQMMQTNSMANPSKPRK